MVFLELSALFSNQRPLTSLTTCVALSYGGLCTMAATGHYILLAPAAQLIADRCPTRAGAAVLLLLGDALPNTEP